MTRPLLRWIVGLSVAGAILAGVFAIRVAFPDLQTRADRIQLEVSAMRGLPFVHPVEAGRESNAEFMAFVERRLRKEPIPPHYGIVVRAVGLYRGPIITDPEGLLKNTMTTAAGAYYDVDRRKFFLLREIPESRLSAGLAHELYHALQDQYFGIERYLAPPGPLNSDQHVARRAVIEGEASYVQFMYTLKTADDRMPTHERLGKFIRAQSENSHAFVRATISQHPNLAKVVGDETAAALQRVDKLPPFIWDLTAETVRRGVEFIHAVHALGWTEVEKLYRDSPPASSEQVLHPEKWFSREEPVSIGWPAFEQDALWADWELLGQDVLGEFQWRLVFRENGLAADAASLSAGWGGDRYAVLRNRTNGKVLLLMYTSWDTDEDAHEFAHGYRRVLAAKYATEPTSTRMLEKGRDVIIVEGGEESDLAAFVAFAERGRERR